MKKGKRAEADPVDHSALCLRMEGWLRVTDDGNFLFR